MNGIISCNDAVGELDFQFEVFMPSMRPLELAINNDESKIIDTTFENIDVDNILNVTFDDSVKESDKWYYLVAAASGMMTAAMDIFWVGKISLNDAHTWGEENVNKFVIAVAKTRGYKGNDLSGAIRKLEKDFKIPSDELTGKFGGGLRHHLRDFAHHPTIVGLIFSVLTQFTGMGYGTNHEGSFVSHDVSKEFIGKNFAEKILYGVVRWFFHLISDVAGSNQYAGAGTGIPGPLLASLKEMSALQVFKDINVNNGSDDISIWLSKWFNGTYFKSEENPKGIRFDLRTEMGLAHEVSRQVVPVIINECIVRCFFFTRRLFKEIKSKEIHSINDFQKLGPERFLPFNNRTLARMLTISSGVFMTIDAAEAAINNLKTKNIPGFFLSINYFGIARFAFACKVDSKYIAEDFKKIYEEFWNKHNKQANENIKRAPEIKLLMLNERQVKILMSLKLQKILYDIEQNKGEKKVADKINWQNEWKKIAAEGIGIEENDCFIEDERALYDYIRYELADNDDAGWLYLIAIELMLFNPYHSLNTKNDQKYKGLKSKSEYEKNIFCKKQNFIDEKSFELIQKTYRKYEGRLNKNTQKVVAGVATTAAVTLASGGLAVVFAPGIAVFLAGGSVAGLSGAALTSASLAIMGGGSLAAGGLGMAGGTAIIAGGGALLGMTGSGVASLSSIMMLSSKGYTLNECAKLLTFCKCFLIDKNNKIDVVAQFRETIENVTGELEREISSEEDKTQEQKKLTKDRKISLQYLKICSTQLEKLVMNNS